LIGSFWLEWCGLYAWVLLHFGLPLRTALIDSAICNVVLLGACVLISQVLKHYLPVKNRYFHLIILCFVLTFAWIFISKAILIWVLDNENGYRDFLLQSLPVRFAITFLIIGCVALLAVLMRIINDQKESEKRKTDAEKLAREAELYKLRQQLQPHFLFNSLNSISALVSAKPDLARKMIQQLSDFLRGTVKKEEQQWVPLEEEFTQLQLYLDIEKVRFGHRLFTEINRDETAKECKIPALLLQPVVENAIKFGLYDTMGDVRICIHATRDNNDLVITIENPFDPETSSPKQGTGFGLNSVQRRLYLLFARNDLLHTNSTGNKFKTTVKIPQHD
jgi:sensor histidine kinase YesM